MRTSYLLLIFVLFITGCTKEKSKYTKEQVEEKADSIFQSKLPYLKQQAQEDFENRLPIELKVKVDSILNKTYEIPSQPELEDEGQKKPFSSDDSLVFRSLNMDTVSSKR